MAALDRRPRAADVVAIAPVSLARFSATSFSRQLQASSALALAIARLQSARLRDLNRRFLVQHADTTSRVLDALVYLAATFSGESGPCTPVPTKAQ